MNKALTILLTALGGSAFFGVSFLGFARLSGVPLRDIAVVGPILIPLLGVDTPPASTDQEPKPAPREFGTTQEVVRASIGALGAFTLPAPFDRDELQRLEDELEAQREHLARRSGELDARERDLVEQLARLEHMSADFARLRADIEAREAALDLRAQEVARDEAAESEADVARYQKLGSLLAALDPREAGGRIVQHAPEEAARILATLPSPKAAAILAALPAKDWATYSGAYAALAE